MAGCGRASASAAAIWTIGPLRRGQLWESTAIPEIRLQAAAPPADVLDALPREDVRAVPRDPYGLPMSASRSCRVAHYVDAVDRILRVQSGAEHPVGAAVRADPRSRSVMRCWRMLGAEWGATST